MVRPLALLALGATLAAPLSAQTTAPPINLTRFQSQVDAFARADSVSPPAPGGIVFIGSSIFRLWTTLKEQMAPLPVLNRGFGGSQTPEMLYYFDRVVVPYKPRFVAYYCGSNDVNAGDAASVTIERVRQFHERLQRELPGTRMFFVSVIRAPDKRKRWAAVDSINTAIRQYAATTKTLEFIDVNPVLFDAKGNVRAELYLADSLHYKPEAYTLFTSVVKPVLERAWKEKR